MGNIFQKIYGKMERNHKEMLIESSGSTKDSKHEKIRSGQSYLYKKQGMESEVVEIRFHKKIRGGILSQAVTRALQRYPYFNTKLVEQDGDFYIVQNEQPPVPRKTEELPQLGHVSCGHRLLDVTYFENSIYVSFHHALCDGRGIMAFVETMIYYYCLVRYNSKTKPDGIRLADDELLPGETVDPFFQTYEYDATKEFVSISKDAYALPENVPNGNVMNYRYEVKIPQDQFIQACRNNNATPLIMIAILACRSIAKNNPDYDKQINANFAMDIRDALDCPNTFKNCVKSMVFPFAVGYEKQPIKEVATEYRRLLAAQRDRDYCRREVNNMMGMFEKLDSLGSYEEKQKMMGFFDGMLLHTFMISYLGKFNLGDNAKYIADMHFYNSGAAGMGINMNACGDYIVLDFKQTFSSDKYMKGVCAGLDELGVSYQASDTIPFLTPGDSIIRRN